MSIIIGANLIILSRRSKHYSLFLSVPHKKHMEQMLINSKVTFFSAPDPSQTKQDKL